MSRGTTVAQLGADIIQARAAVNETLVTAGPTSQPAYEARAHHDYLLKRAAYYFPVHN